jgi:hypothetical protein
VDALIGQNSNWPPQLIDTICRSCWDGPHQSATRPSGLRSLAPSLWTPGPLVPWGSERCISAVLSSARLQATGPSEPSAASTFSSYCLRMQCGAVEWSGVQCSVVQWSVAPQGLTSSCHDARPKDPWSRHVPLTCAVRTPRHCEHSV